MRYGSTFKFCGKLHPGRLCGAKGLAGINSNYILSNCTAAAVAFDGDLVLLGGKLSVTVASERWETHQDTTPRE